MILIRKFITVLMAVFIFHFSFFIFHLRSASAQIMSNKDYIIQTQDINTVTNVSANAERESKIDPSVSEGVNFKVKKGFDTAPSTLPLSVSLSSDLVDFGTLSPTNPIIRTIDLNVSSIPFYGYSVLLFENGPLAAIPPVSKTFIPDTTCDNGECGIENAAEWINALTYGLGYRCDNVKGTDCDSSFVKTDFYKHFPDIASNDDLQPIMAGVGSDNKSARLSYKVNISGTQAQGIYNNVLTYIAVPNF